MVEDMSIPCSIISYGLQNVGCKPQLRLSDAIKILKGNIARWLFLAHPEIKSQLCGGHLWNPSYFVATVSDRTLDQITVYINNQKTK